MNTADFLDKFKELFEETDLDTITLDAKFRDIEEWSSLLALTLIAMVDQEYQVKLTGDDIRNSTTVKDITEKVAAKQNS